MGRRKVELKLIEDKNSRQVTFSKRRNGLIKKARELSILCDVDVAVVIFSSGGRLYEFCSGDSLDSILERYHRHYEEDASTSMNVGAADSNSEYFKFNHLSHAELVRLVERQLEGPNLQKLSLTELVQLEKRLHATLAKTRARKTELMFESIMTLQDKEKKLSKEKELLAKEEKKLRKENELLAKEIAELTKNGSREANPAVNTTLNLL